MKRNLSGIRKFINELGFFAQYVDEIVAPRAIQRGYADKLEKKYLEARSKTEELIKIFDEILKIAKDEDKIKVILT